jgi:O-antigen/teichoic acid export membrane protein
MLLPSVDAKIIYALSIILWLGLIGPSHFLVMTSQQRFSSQIRIATNLLNAVATIATAVATHRADITFAVSALTTTMFTGLQVLAVPSRLRRAVFLPAGFRVSRSDALFGVGNVINDQMSNFVFSRSEVVFFTSGMAAARGRFAASQTIGARSTLLPDALLGNISLGLTNAHGRGPDQLRQAFHTTTSAVCALLAIISPLTLAAVSALIVPVLGHSYAGLACPALALSVMSLVQTGCAPLSSLRFAQKAMRPVLIAGATGALVDVVLALLLVHRYGVTGAVISNMIATATFIACTVFLFGRVSGFRGTAVGHLTRVLTTVILGSAPGVALLFASRNLGMEIFLPLALLWTLLLVRLRYLRSDVRVALQLLGEATPTIRRFLGSRILLVALGQNHSTGYLARHAND